MPEIIIYTNDGDCANGVAEIQPFTTGDSSDWTLRFNNGTDFYEVDNVSMRVGHTNGLPQGSYNDAFKWSDRAGNVSIANIAISAAGVPTLTFDTSTSPLSNPPLGGVVGTNGVYVLRGADLDGSISSASIEYAGLYLGYPTNQTEIFTIPNTQGGSPGVVQLTATGAYEVQNWLRSTVSSAHNIWQKGTVASVSIIEPGSGFTSDQNLVVVGTGVTKKFIEIENYNITSFSAGFFEVFQNGAAANIILTTNSAKYQVPFMSDESSTDIIAATTLSPYSDGEITSSVEYDDSTLIIRPETVASANLLKSTSDPTKWTGTMDPINAYTNARLSLRNSTQLDLQIRGDGRTLFQGQLTILNKMT